MSTPRLQLKQPTGWFAAGREFAQALTLLSDGAFELYVHLCLNANRRTGRLSATVDDLARVLTRAPTAVAMNLDELEACAVCRVIRNGSQLVLEIRDRFWPYEKQQTPGCVPEPEVEFVQKVRNMFLAPACVQAGFSAADEKIATVFHPVRGEWKCKKSVTLNRKESLPERKRRDNARTLSHRASRSR